MTSFHFISSNSIELNTLKNITKFINSYPDFQTLVLNNENELEILLKLMGIDKIKSLKLNESDFCKYWDISNFRLPEYNEKEFDAFYQKWLNKTGRENNMNEYGNLIFLQELSVNWNNLDYKIIVKEKNTFKNKNSL